MRHPVLTHRVRLIIWWLVWLFLTLGQSLLFYFAYGSFVNESIADGIVSLILYSGIALSIWYPFTFFNTGEKRPLTLILNIALIGALSISLWMILTRVIVSLVLPETSVYPAYWSATFPYRVGTGVFIYGILILSYYLFVSITYLGEKNAQEARLEALVKETELKMLRSQINPHFLFNSLNSVSSLTITDPAKAREMVIKLSDFMRYALSKKDDQPVSLRSELENIRLYLDIEKVRFGDRLETEENIGENCLDVRMPVMLLQPLFENAVKHGVYESIERIMIRTKAQLTDDMLQITISNNFDPDAISKKGTGTGLQNVVRRLELSYGKRASLEAVRGDSSYTVTLVIPNEQL
jgi:sensor histidine kinase YesM